MYLIKLRIKYAIAVLIATAFVFVTYDKLQNIQAERNLPAEVTEIELVNWTKTREPNEISGDEKKINSYDKLAEFNEGILESDVQTITNLYEESGKLIGIDQALGSEKDNDNDVICKDKDDETDSLDKSKTDNSSMIGESEVSDEVVKSKLKESSADEDSVSEIEEISTNESSVSEIKKSSDDGASVHISEVIGDNLSQVTGDTVSNDNDIEQSINQQENSNIKGNKVLRTCIKLPNSSNIINYKIEDLYGYLKSDKVINWDNQNKITWDLCTRYDDEKKQNSIEWRMISATVNITDQQIALIDKKNTVTLFGIATDDETGVEFIMPCNDIISVFINGKSTNINYHNIKTSSLVYTINQKNVNFKSMVKSSENKCLNESYHANLSEHTKGYHIDMSNFKDLLINEELDMAGNLCKGENTIDILIGNYINSSDYKNKLCGFSKLNLYIIEKPTVDVEMQFYKYKNDSEPKNHQIDNIVFFNQDCKPTKGDNVYIRIDIVNKSNNIELENLIFKRLSNEAQTISLNIDENKAYFKGKEITDTLRCYLDEDFTKEYGLEALKNLKPGQRITLMSDKISYLITENDSKTERIFAYGNVISNYIKGKLEFRSDEKKIRIPISNEFGVLEVSCSIEDESNGEENNQELGFLVDVYNNYEFANLYITPGKTYTLNNLSISENYYINLVLPQDYEVVEEESSDTYSSLSQNQFCLKQGSTNNYTKKIQIKLKKINKSYFYKNKNGGVSINVE